MGNDGKIITTGIVKQIRPNNALIKIKTLEGLRTIHAFDIIDIVE